MSDTEGQEALSTENALHTDQVIESQELQRISMINALISIWIAVFAAFFAMKAFQDGQDYHFDEICIARSGTLSTADEGKKRTCVITQVQVDDFEAP